MGGRRRWEGGDSHQHTPNFRNCSGQAGCVYLVPFCVFVIFPSSVSFLLMRVKEPVILFNVHMNSRLVSHSAVVTCRAPRQSEEIHQLTVDCR